MTGTNQSCIAAASATAQQCVNASRLRLAAGTGCAAMCIANNAPNASGQCGVATTVCAATDGYDSTDRVCVTSSQTATQCQAVSRVRLTGGNCATICATGNAPNASGQCGTATAVCTGTQGYDSSSNVCLAAGSVDEAADCAVFTGWQDSLSSRHGLCVGIDLSDRQSGSQCHRHDMRHCNSTNMP